MSICFSSAKSLELFVTTFASTYFQYIPVHLSSSQAALIVSIMFASFTIGNVFNIFVVNFIATKNLIFIHLTIAFVSFLGLLFAGNSQVFLWILSAGNGFGYSILSATFLAFFSNYIDITDRISMIMWVTNGAILAVPLLGTGYLIEILQSIGCQRSDELNETKDNSRHETQDKVLSAEDMQSDNESEESDFKTNSDIDCKKRSDKKRTKNARKYVCDYNECRKSYFDRKDLRDHLMSHSGERHFCDFKNCCKHYSHSGFESNECLNNNESNEDTSEAIEDLNRNETNEEECDSNESQSECLLKTISDNNCETNTRKRKFKPIRSDNTDNETDDEYNDSTITDKEMSDNSDEDCEPRVKKMRRNY
ncbi:unnamed protein product, partial [Oppiella nova]